MLWNKCYVSLLEKLETLGPMVKTQIFSSLAEQKFRIWSLGWVSWGFYFHCCFFNKKEKKADLRNKAKINWVFTRRCCRIWNPSILSKYVASSSNCPRFSNKLFQKFTKKIKTPQIFWISPPATKLNIELLVAIAAAQENSFSSQIYKQGLQWWSSGEHHTKSSGLQNPSPESPGISTASLCSSLGWPLLRSLSPGHKGSSSIIWNPLECHDFAAGAASTCKPEFLVGFFGEFVVVLKFFTPTSCAGLSFSHPRNTGGGRG